MPAWFQFLSLRSHREVIAAKDETIALLREQVQQLTSSLESFREAMKAVQTAQPAPRPRREPSEREPAKHIDYANLDPADNSGLLQAAIAEMGAGTKIPAAHVIQRAEQIKRAILAHRQHSQAQALNPTVPLPTATTAADVETLINATIAEGEAAGRVN